MPLIACVYKRPSRRPVFVGGLSLGVSSQSGAGVVGSVSGRSKMTGMTEPAKPVLDPSDIRDPRRYQGSIPGRFFDGSGGLVSENDLLHSPETMDQHLRRNDLI